MLADFNVIKAYYRLEDSDLSESLQPFLEMAVLISGAEKAYISVFDEEWQYYLSTKGFGNQKSSREGSLCNLVLDTERPVVLSPLKDEPKAIKYAKKNWSFFIGIPLTDSHQITLGTFCVLGTSEREIPQNERKLFELLGKQIVGFLERRKDLQHYNEIWQESIRALDEENKRMEVVKSKLAHDMRGPIGNLKMIGDLVNEGQVDDAEDMVMLFNQSQKTIDHLMHMMQELTNDLLHAKKDQPDSNFELIDFKNLVQSIVEANQFQKKYPGAEVNVVNSDFFQGPYLDLFIVLQNLIENALKYNQSSDKLCELAVNHLANGVEITVSDNGIGIPPDRQGTLFEKGARVHANSGYEGSGLGLFNVAETIRKYNGKISVESQQNEGSRFTIFFGLNK